MRFIPYIVILLLIGAVIVLALLLHKEKNMVSYLIDTKQSQMDDLKNAHKSEVEDLCDRHRDEIRSIRQECDKEIQRERERIEGRKELLSQKSDKELLIDVMLALEKYAGRLDRIEQSASHENIVQLINDTAKTVIDEMYDCEEDVLNAIGQTDSQSVADAFNASVEEIKSSIDMSSNSSTIYSIESEIRSVKSSLDSLRSSLDDVRSAADKAQNTAEEAKVLISCLPTN